MTQKPKAPTQASKSVKNDPDMLTLLTAIRNDQSRFVLIGERIVNMLLVQNEKLDMLLKAYATETEPSPVANTLGEILTLLQSQTSSFEQLTQQIISSIQNEDTELADHLSWKDF